jgi:hypothetical protein
MKWKPPSEVREDTVCIAVEGIGIFISIIRLVFISNISFHSESLTPQLQAPSAQPQVAQLQEADPQPGMMIKFGIKRSKSGL